MGALLLKLVCTARLERDDRKGMLTTVNMFGRTIGRDPVVDDLKPIQVEPHLKALGLAGLDPEQLRRERENLTRLARMAHGRGMISTRLSSSPKGGRPCR